MADPCLRSASRTVESWMSSRYIYSVLWYDIWRNMNSVWQSSWYLALKPHDNIWLSRHFDWLVSNVIHNSRFSFEFITKAFILSHLHKNSLKASSLRWSAGTVRNASVVVPTDVLNYRLESPDFCGPDVVNFVFTPQIRRSLLTCRHHWPEVIWLLIPQSCRGQEAFFSRMILYDPWIHSAFSYCRFHDGRKGKRLTKNYCKVEEICLSSVKHCLNGRKRMNIFGPHTFSGHLL